MVLKSPDDVEQRHADGLADVSQFDQGQGAFA